MKSFVAILVLIVYFILGQFSHDHIYSFTLSCVSFFSGNKIHFYGKLWNFFGVPAFGFFLMIIPLIGYVSLRELRAKGVNGKLRHLLVSLVVTVGVYIATCFLYARYLLNMMKHQHIQSDDNYIHLSHVNIYLVVGVSFAIGIILSHFLSKSTARHAKSKDSIDKVI